MPYDTPFPVYFKQVGYAAPACFGFLKLYIALIDKAWKQAFHYTKNDYVHKNLT